MQTVTLIEAQAQLSRLLELVEAGEEITITKDGRAVARMVNTLARVQLPSLAEFRATQVEQREPAADFIRKLRDRDRY